MIDLLREGLQGVAAHRLRSMLSTLGILFGVAAVIGILSIGEGARREQEQLIAQLGILNFQVKNKPDPDDEEELAALRRKSRGLTRRDVGALAGSLPNARLVGGMREVDVRDIVPLPTEDLRVLGAEPSWVGGTRLRLVEGRMLSAIDERERAAVAVVGTNAARALFGADSAVGRSVRLGEVWVRVVGVFDAGVGGTQVEGVDVDDRSRDLLLPLTTALRRFEVHPEQPELTEIQVSVEETSQVRGHTALARRVLQRMHREQEDFDVIVPLSLLEQSQQQQRIFNLVMGLIAGISLLVGGIGIMNIMLASVLERTREIGIRLAVGATPAQIRLLFLAEASVISLTGGVLGVLAGYGIAWTVAGVTGWATAVSPWAVLLAAAISMAEGVVFGFLPANQAARLPPALAVRQVA